jgi:hypothetical protein
LREWKNVRDIREGNPEGRRKWTMPPEEGIAEYSTAADTLLLFRQE